MIDLDQKKCTTAKETCLPMSDHRQVNREYMLSGVLALAFGVINMLIMRYSFDLKWTPAAVVGGLIGASPYLLDVAVWRYCRARREAMVTDPYTPTGVADNWIFRLRHRIRVWHIVGFIAGYLLLDFALTGIWAAQFVMYVAAWGVLVVGGRIFDVHRNLRQWCAQCGLAPRTHDTPSTAAGDTESTRN